MSCVISAITFEHYPHGLGVSHSSPRLSWSFDGSARDWKQAQYEIRITRLTPTTYSVSSPDSILVPWPAPPLQSRESAVVEVRVRSSSGEWTAWATERLEAALLERNDWSAKLVTASDQATRAPKTDPISYFSFVLPGGPEESVKPVRLRTTFKAPSTYKQARLYVTACGVHYTFLNGQPVSPDLLEPGWTKYDTTLAYRTYDVTALINGDTNILASWVGEGWYAGRLGYFEGQRHVYGHRVGLIAQLEVDGQVVARSGNGWQWSYGAIAAGEIYDGEAFDSRIDDEEWKTTVTVHDWKQAQVLDLPTTTLVTSESPPIRPYARLQAKELITTPSGKTILDLAQNFAGFVQVVGQPPIEGTLTFRFAEVLEHGELGTRPLMGARATDSIILGGRVQGWTPKFTFHGFRYVEVSGWPGVTLEDICGVAISSAMNQTGTFTCSHMLLNRLHENVVWSTRSNTISIPSDCPQRAERLGWTGDIQIFAPTINYLFNSAGFLRSWLRDLRDEQEALGGGRVPCVIPHLPHWNILSKPHAVWGDVSALLPDDLHLSFGDSDILKESFASMTDWLDRGIPRNAEGTWDETTFQYADWLAPASPPDQPWNAPTDSFLVANAYLIHTTRKVARIAQVLGRPEEAERYEKQATDLLEKFHANYVTPKSRVLSDTQAALALILHFDLVKPGVANQRDILTRRLGELVGKDRWQVSTGFAGTPIILNTLAEHGLLHHGYGMLLAKKSPSWLAPVLLGATSVWERWDSMLADKTINPGRMTSFNHYALGSVASFMHQVIGGISPLEPGWRHVRIRPQPGATLTHAHGVFLSPYGKVSCSWKIVGDRFKVDIEVPPNCTAELVLPGVQEVVGSGSRRYDVLWTPDVHWPPTYAFRGDTMPMDENAWCH